MFLQYASFISPSSSRAIGRGIIYHKNESFKTKDLQKIRVSAYVGRCRRHAKRDTRLLRYMCSNDHEFLLPYCTVTVLFHPNTKMTGRVTPLTHVTASAHLSSKLHAHYSFVLIVDTYYLRTTKSSK